MRHAAGAIGFAGSPIDRADALRTDPARLAALIAGGTALLLDLDGLAPRTDAAGALRWRSPDLAAAELVFLGLLDGRPRFAAVPLHGDADPVLARQTLWDAIERLPSADLALYGGARSMLDWHARHRFCANCGASTLIAKGGWQRNCDTCGASHFPRTDPVAIMLVEHDGKDGRRLLLGRQARFPVGRYSALAGFVEPGETLEEAVAREVQEEAGVTVRDVRYLFSQPWPFPSQLMLACIGQAGDDRLTLDVQELEDARWFTRAEVAQALAGGDNAAFVPPPAAAVARTMLQWWLDQDG
ncbi:NUDIX hydrolase [Croceibacterium mercuriale]|uniref:NAD(+) diphosphatase n=1 Tax=Croceibacterium mercuriale TaxID=1572751 RepID=A0A0B2BZI2_9SPHN|nr:NAD(+) diphosphatase [Croceibacterium mercuriale]KHL25442.1 NUDIX hydrolase [Croceibacterium mercuriale]